MQVFVVICDGFDEDLYGMCTKVVVFFFFAEVKYVKRLALRPFVFGFFLTTPTSLHHFILSPIVFVLTLVAGICPFNYVFLC